MPKTIVYKIGGEILRNPELFEGAMQEIIRIKSRAPKTSIVIVHGAGPQLDKRFEQAKIPVKKINGKRITTKEGMRIIWGFVPEESRKLVDRLFQNGIEAESIDSSVTTLAEIKDKSLGLVGEPVGVNTRQLARVLKKRIIPVVSVCGVTKQGQIVNVNADEVAANIAIALKADLLELKTNVKGILEKGRLVPRINAKRARQMIKEKTVEGGMLVKLNAARNAVRARVKQARISGIRAKGTTIKRKKRRAAK